MNRLPTLLKLHGRWALEFPVDSDVSHLIYLTGNPEDRPLVSDQLGLHEREELGQRQRGVRVPLIRAAYV